MNLSVWTWPYSTKYYLLHPWKWFSHLFSNIRAAWRRSTKGFCYLDASEFHEWFLAIVPQMLRVIADGEGFPGYGEFDEFWKWENWLRSVADVFESLQEENWYSLNEYEEDFHRLSEAARKSNRDKNGFLNVTYDDIPELKEISKKYFKRVQELNETRQKLLEDTFQSFVKNFFMLWD